MNKKETRDFLKWLFCDPLPVWILIILIKIHLLVVYIFDFDPINANNYFALGLEIIGGLILLIDNIRNIELFKGFRLKGIIVNWIHSCPRLKRHYVLKASSGNYQFMPGKSRLIHHRKLNSIEEIQGEMYGQLDSVYEYISEINSGLLEQIKALETDFEEAIKKNSQEIKHVEEVTIEYAIGDFKWQILGVLLVFYGAIIHFYFLIKN